MKKTGLFIFITSICLIQLIPRTFKNGPYFKNDDINNCNPNSIILILKKISVIALILMNFYRIYFYGGWLHYIHYNPAEKATKVNMREIMSYQRGYRIVHYGIIILTSSILFLLGSILEYKNYKNCLNGKNNAINLIYKYEKNSLIFLGIILVIYCIEFYYYKRLVYIVIKNWNSINYNLGKMSIWRQLFFFIKINFIQILSFLAFGLILYFNFKLKLFNIY